MRLFDMFKSKHKDFILDAFCDPSWTVKEVITPVPGGCADCELTYSDDSSRVRRIEKWRCYMYAETQVGAFPLYMEVRDYPAGSVEPVIRSRIFGKENERHTSPGLILMHRDVNAVSKHGISAEMIKRGRMPLTSSTSGARRTMVENTQRRSSLWEITK